MQIDHRGTNDNNEKLGQRGSGRGHVTYFCSIGSQILYIFETHVIGQTPSSLERYLVVISMPSATTVGGEYHHHVIRSSVRPSVRPSVMYSA